MEEGLLAERARIEKGTFRNTPSESGERCHCGTIMAVINEFRIGGSLNLLPQLGTKDCGKLHKVRDPTNLRELGLGPKSQ